MSDIERLEERLKAVERTVVEGDYDLGELSGLDSLTEDLERIETRLEELEQRVASLEASTQSIDGYVSRVETVNDNVEKQADAAIAAVDRLERRVDQIESGEVTVATQSREAEERDPGNGTETDDTDPLLDAAGGEPQSDASRQESDPLWEEESSTSADQSETGTERSTEEETATPETEPTEKQNSQQQTEPDPSSEKKEDPSETVTDSDNEQNNERAGDESADDRAQMDQNQDGQQGRDDGAGIIDSSAPLGFTPQPDSAKESENTSANVSGDMDEQSTSLRTQEAPSDAGYTSDIHGNTYKQVVEELINAGEK